MGDLIDIGVFGEKTPEASLGKPLYLEKRRITAAETTVRVVVELAAEGASVSIPTTS